MRQRSHLLDCLIQRRSSGAYAPERWRRALWLGANPALRQHVFSGRVRVFLPSGGCLQLREGLRP